MDRRQPPEVEFLTPEPDPSETGEALPSDPVRSRRSLAVGALVLVGAALVARAVTDKQADKPAAAPPTSSRPSPTPLRLALPPVSTAPQDLRACPLAGDGQSACVSTRQVPAGTLAAVRGIFPRGVRTYTLDERIRDTGLGGGAIWYRELRLRQGVERISIVLHRKITDDIDLEAVNDDGAASSLSVSHPLGPLQLTITVVAPSGTILDTASVVPLSRDRRLVALK